MSGVERIASRAIFRTPRFTTSSFLIGSLAIAATCVAMSALGGMIGAVYHAFAYGGTGGYSLQTAAAGCLVALLYAVPFLSRRAYTIPGYLRGAHRPSRIFYAWNVAFVALLVVAFLTQTTVAISRATAILFYVSGLIGMIGIESAIRSAIVAGLRTGRLAPCRLMLVGDKDATDEIAKRLATTVSDDESMSVRVVAVTTLAIRSGRPATPEDIAYNLEQAVSTARAWLPDEVIIATAWANDDAVDAAVRAFQQLPVAIHLDGGPVLARFSGDLRLHRIGSVCTVSVAELPLSPAQVIAKRAFDIVAASIGLVLVSPILAVVALLIKRDSPGPVFFRQERRGFNQDTFWIYKFRSMADGDAGFVQARPGDQRITPLGRLLRRSSIDELPQLLNVLKGDMSLVGPRPHAIEHDLDFEQRIRRYPRRLNMKPGITGWAQVNGYRGQTDTDDKMKHRVEADLYYIDNWTILFDLYILLLTVLSPKTFNNAG